MKAIITVLEEGGGLSSRGALIRPPGPGEFGEGCRLMRGRRRDCADAKCATQGARDQSEKTALLGALDMPFSLARMFSPLHLVTVPPAQTQDSASEAPPQDLPC